LTWIPLPSCPMVLFMNEIQVSTGYEALGVTGLERKSLGSFTSFYSLTTPGYTESLIRLILVDKCS
jgi:hypothetical protein